MKKSILIVACTLAAGTALANSWIFPGSGKWEIDTNWSLGVPPGFTQSVYITNAGDKVVTIDATTSGSFSNTLTVSNLTVGGALGATNTLSLNGAGSNIPLHVLYTFDLASGGALSNVDSSLQVDGTLTVGAPTAGSNGLAPATTTVFNATLNAGALAVGSAAGGQGNLVIQSNSVVIINSNVAVVSGSLSVTSSVAISGGSFIATNSPIQVGSAGNGLFTISGGDHVIRQLLLGGTNSTGSFVMSGGTLKILGNGSGRGQGVVANSLDYEEGAVDGSGTSLTLGFNGHDGSATLDDGTVKFKSMYVGGQDGCSGFYTNKGGSMVITDSVIVGDDCKLGGSGAIGTLVVSGGTLYVTNSTHTAVMEVRNGSVTLGTGGVLVVDNLILTNTCGRFTNSGGGILLPSDAFYTVNLLLNPGAEFQLDNWTATGNPLPSTDYGIYANPHTGSYDFSFTGTSTEGFLSQTVALVGNQGITEAKLDSGQLAVSVSFWEQTVPNGPGPYDDAQVALAFRDASSSVISSVSTPEIDSYSGVWSNYTAQYLIPVGTRFIDYTINFIPYGDGDTVLVDDNLLLAHDIELPSLNVSTAGTNVVITWPAWASNFGLESNTDLSTPNLWQSVPNIPAVTPAGLAVTNSRLGRDRFYRLRGQ
jgi:hypothetical protein